MGALCCGEARGKDGVDLPPGLQAPNVYLVIGSLMVLYASISGMLSFALGLTTLLASLLMMMLVAMVVVEPFERNYPTSHWLMVMCVVTAALSSACGISNYHQFYAKHQAAVAGRKYKDVSADSQASAHGDGGIIEFAENTIVDNTRAIGLLSSGTTYCVAPIFDRKANVQPQSAGPLVQYWAVGKDCCLKRSNFECDDAGDPDARSGIVMHEGEETVTSSFLAPHLDEPDFQRSIRAAAALFGMRTAETPVLVRWVKEPDKQVEAWKFAAIFMYCGSCIFNFAVIAVVWCLVHRNYDTRLRDAMVVLADNGASGIAAAPSNGRPRKDPFLLGTNVGAGT